MTTTENMPHLDGADWSDENQKLLIAEFARLECLVAGEDSAAANEQIERSRLALPSPAAIDQVVSMFGLSTFERDLLLLAAGCEMHGPLAARVEARSPSHRSGLTFGLALAALAEPHWSALTPARPLRGWRMIEVAEGVGLSGASLRIDERLLHYIAGVNYLDPRLRSLVRMVTSTHAVAPRHVAQANELAELLRPHDAPCSRVQLIGDDESGKQDVAAGVASALGLRLHVVSAEDLPATPHETEAWIALWEREAVLLESALLIECGESVAVTRRIANRMRGLTFLAVREGVRLDVPDLRCRVDRPDRGEQQMLWESALGPIAARVNGAVEGIAAQYRWSARDIALTAIDVGQEAARGRDPSEALWRACREREVVKIEGLAQRITPAAGWSDLVLPAPQLELLRQIASQARRRMRVLEHWGFAARNTRGLGVTALFSGESGTGKTLAAEVLAAELHLDLYRIDLSAVVSKYIGETEKNLARVFDAAENTGAILLFDEADALFGKRSDVKDSHDRYANIEVSYLLQRMEAYRGLAILTTNQKTALDTAFQRRLRFIVHFPFPEAGEREAIWRGMFPATAPLAELDYSRLARLSASGGGIRNIALTAAFFAAELGEPIGMNHLLRAARAEAVKRERPLSEAETRGWV